MFTCTYFVEYVVIISCCCYRRAPTGWYSCIAQGASPGFVVWYIYWAPKGRHNPKASVPIPALLVPLLRSSFFIWSVCPQGFISGFALIPPWALQECRAYGTHNAPGFWCDCPAVERSLISCIALQWRHANINHKLTYCPKTIYFASKHRHNVLKIKEESLLDWLLDIWGQKQKKN